ncbi:MAG TPA: nitroreductase family deazaflavin-dependent oxidoreductase [Acidimicrobiia bacterium]|nr:nitroreductase family deazaflavin-dependent oxidoreductase [Acidimicrobiia bacterium]
MPVPKWVAGINKRFFNKLELKRGVRPVLTHVGRTSGEVFHTPLDAHPVDGGFIFICMYGPDSDWVKNILASGTAHLTVEDQELDLDSPRLMTMDEALEQLPDSVKMPPSWLNVSDFLRMSVAA